MTLYYALLIIFEIFCIGTAGWAHGQAAKNDIPLSALTLTPSLLFIVIFASVNTIIIHAVPLSVIVLVAFLHWLLATIIYIGTIFVGLRS